MRVMIVDDEPMVLAETTEVVEKALPGIVTVCAETASEALSMAGEQQIDIALLDIEMPGMNGLQLAKKLKEKNPDTNIIFATAYAEYALEAFAMYASGYLIKPLLEKDVLKAFQNLRHPVEYQEGKLKVQCFGNFEVFYAGEPVAFARAKAKEIFAYLVDLRGAAANTGELCAVLWEDSVSVEKNKHYLRNLISDVRKALRECHAEDVFIYRRNQFAIDPDKIECDYYKFLEKDVSAINSYRGEYMKQYSWAEFSLRQFH